MVVFGKFVHIVASGKINGTLVAIFRLDSLESKATAEEGISCTFIFCAKEYPFLDCTMILSPRRTPRKNSDRTLFTPFVNVVCASLARNTKMMESVNEINRRSVPFSSCIRQKRHNVRGTFCIRLRSKGRFSFPIGTVPSRTFRYMRAFDGN